MSLKTSLAVDSYDSTNPLSFSEAETAVGLAAELSVNREEFAGFVQRHGRSANGYSGILWMCIEVGRILDREVPQDAWDRELDYPATIEAFTRVLFEWDGDIDSATLTKLVRGTIESQRR